MSPDNRTCFVIMPFGKKVDTLGVEVDFDRIYAELIREPIERNGLTPVRCDEIEAAGSIHEDMFEHIATAAVVVVDITSLNPNVFYELGVRHALRECVTVLIRREGVAAPFNIQDLRVIDYPAGGDTLTGARDRIHRFIANGLRSREGDSPITPVLARLRDRLDDTRRIDTMQRFAYELLDRPGVVFEVRTGDLSKWTGIDVWVNSENTNMQMARFYDRGLSAMIRFHGAEKDENGEIVSDTIAIDLAQRLRGRESVSPGTVFETTAGALRATHGVQRIFHAAMVQGVPGAGYRAVSEMVGRCAELCLRRMDANVPEGGDPVRSIAIPMIGSGAGGDDVGTVARVLVQTAVGYLTREARSRIEHVVFMAWNRRDLEACLQAMEAVPGLARIEQAP